MTDEVGLEQVDSPPFGGDYVLLQRHEISPHLFFFFEEALVMCEEKWHPKFGLLLS